MTDAQCDDGLACTADSCHRILGCRHFAPPAPPEVANLRLALTATPGQALLSWDPGPGSSSYNVYRGTAPDMSDLACLQSGVAGESTLDDGLLPAPGSGHTYLETGRNCAGESTPGFRSDGLPRSLAAACP